MFPRSPKRTFGPIPAAITCSTAMRTALIPTRVDDPRLRGAVVVPVPGRDGLAGPEPVGALEAPATNRFPTTSIPMVLSPGVALVPSLPMRPPAATPMASSKAPMKPLANVPIADAVGVVRAKSAADKNRLARPTIVRTLGVRAGLRARGLTMTATASGPLHDQRFGRRRSSAGMHSQRWTIPTATTWVF